MSPLFSHAWICAILVWGVVHAADDLVVNTKFGAVQGISRNGVRAFLGIPYAASPGGQNRWTDPQERTPWKPETLNATAFTGGCPQDCVLPPHTCPASMTEDCLTLNIFTPTVDHLTTKQPVMVFLPGGRFEQGAAGVSLYDGSYLANRSGVIVVTMDYRLGALGWLVTDTLNGNFGLKDQRFGLQWVKNNIAAFGGDPTQITLFGQSAGATSTTAHVLSPMSAGFFQRAIIQSNPITLPMRVDAASLGNVFAEDLGCKGANIECLLNQSVSDILAAQKTAEKHLKIFKPLESFLPWTPYIDGAELTLQALEAFATGKYNHMPIMIGSVSEEALLFIYMADKSAVNTAEYILVIFDIFGEDGVGVLERYPATPAIGDKRDAMSVLGTDYIFTASIRNVATSIQKNNDPSQGIYLYQFDHVLSFDAWGPDYAECVGHVCHGAELPFVFHSADEGGWFHFDAAEVKLSYQMMDYWTNFGRTGDPNNGTNAVTLQWPAYNPTSDQNMEFSVPNFVNTGLRKEYCDYFDKIGYHHGW